MAQAINDNINAPFQTFVNIRDNQEGNVKNFTTPGNEKGERLQQPSHGGLDSAKERATQHETTSRRIQLNKQSQPSKPKKVLRCVRCTMKRYQCNREQPCSTCENSGEECIPSTPVPRKKRSPNIKSGARKKSFEKGLQDDIDREFRGSELEDGDEEEESNIDRPKCNKCHKHKDEAEFPWKVDSHGDRDLSACNSCLWNPATYGTLNNNLSGSQIAMSNKGKTKDKAERRQAREATSQILLPSSGSSDAQNGSTAVLSCRSGHALDTAAHNEENREFAQAVNDRSVPNLFRPDGHGQVSEEFRALTESLESGAWDEFLRSWPPEMDFHSWLSTWMDPDQLEMIDESAIMPKTTNLDLEALPYEGGNRSCSLPLSETSDFSSSSDVLSELSVWDWVLTRESTKQGTTEKQLADQSQAARKHHDEASNLGTGDDISSTLGIVADSGDDLYEFPALFKEEEREIFAVLVAPSEFDAEVENFFPDDTVQDEVGRITAISASPSEQQAEVKKAAAQSGLSCGKEHVNLDVRIDLNGTPNTTCCLPNEVPNEHTRGNTSSQLNTPGIITVTMDLNREKSCTNANIDFATEATETTTEELTATKTKIANTGQTDSCPFSTPKSKGSENEMGNRSDSVKVFNSGKKRNHEAARIDPEEVPASSTQPPLKQSRVFKNTHETPGRHKTTSKVFKKVDELINKHRNSRDGSGGSVQRYLAPKTPVPDMMNKHSYGRAHNAYDGRLGPMLSMSQHQQLRLDSRGVYDPNITLQSPLTSMHYSPQGQTQGMPREQYGSIGQGRVSYPNDNQYQTSFGPHQQRCWDRSQRYYGTMTSRGPASTIPFHQSSTNYQTGQHHGRYQDGSLNQGLVNRGGQRSIRGSSHYLPKTNPRLSANMGNARPANNNLQRPYDNTSSHQTRATQQQRSQYASVPAANPREVVTVTFHSVATRQNAAMKLQTEKTRHVENSAFAIAADGLTRVVEISAPAGKNVRGFVNSNLKYLRDAGREYDLKIKLV